MKIILEFQLNGIWKFKRTVDSEWLPGSVPGSVLNDLLNLGKINDPFYRDNEDQAIKFASHNYEYQREFQVDGELLKHDIILLHCDGLDTLTEIFINGTSIGSTANMHRVYEFEVSQLLQPGINSIRIVLYSPVRYIERMYAENPIWGAEDAIAGFSHIRKAHYMFGWDWGPKIPDSGIWRNISILCFKTARISDTYVTQHHKLNSVDLDVKVTVDIWSQSELYMNVRITAPNEKVKEYSRQVTGKENHLGISIDEPDLWWPNGLGKQPLYLVQVELIGDGMIVDKKEYNIGLRTLTVRREKDQWGESFEFQVNGISFFAMGADYIPEDNLLPRCNRQKTYKLIQGCVNANFNTLRIWGGGYYPEDYLYDLCDRYGLVVWQDLMFACAVYDLTDEFSENIKHEVRDNMKRLRHHACLGLWCGNNEMEWCWVERNFPKTEKLRSDYLKQFEVLLSQVAEETDPNTFYWPSSPSSGGGFDRPNNENIGDVHYWEVWHNLKPFTDYRNYYFRFVSEFGFQSFPHLKTVESFTLLEDRNIFSYVMEKHQKNGSANGRILYYLSENFKYPKDFDSMLYTSQLLQAEAVKYGVEHWRRHRGRCMGAIYWQLNDCWPVASWSGIDYYGRWKALHYFAKRFFAPVLLSACEEGERVGLFVTNETLQPANCEVVWKLRSNEFVVKDGRININAAAMSAYLCCDLDFREELSDKVSRHTLYLEYALYMERECISNGTVLFVKAKHFEFMDPKLYTIVEDGGDHFVIKVGANAYARYVELYMREVECLFEDNYFDISRGDERLIIIKKENISRPLSKMEFSNMLQIRSMFDIT